MQDTSKTNSTVPFDPGFAPYTFAFSPSYFYMDIEIKKFKNFNQRKMKYKTLESSIFQLCDNLISFYFGGMLYGAYLKNKYQNNPKQIQGNDFIGLSVEKCKSTDVSIEVHTLEKFIKNNDKSPFATRKMNPKYFFIIDNYIEFLEINNYFTDVKTTSDIKIPSGLLYINNFSETDLDDLYQVIQKCINDQKIEKLLNSKYFENIKPNT